MRPLVGDREIAEVTAGVVVVVGGEREIGRTHRLAQEAEADPGRAPEEPLQERGRRVRAQAIDQRGRGVGERGPEAVHRLVGGGLVDGDRAVAAVVVFEQRGGLAFEELGSVRGGHPDVHAGPRLRLVAGGMRGEAQREREDRGERASHRGSLRS
jgi:hypothetical protein